MLSGRGFCDELITRPEESYRLWRVAVCDQETSKEEAKSPLKGCEYKPTMGCDAERKKIPDGMKNVNEAIKYAIECLYQNWRYCKTGYCKLKEKAIDRTL